MKESDKLTLNDHLVKTSAMLENINFVCDLSIGIIQSKNYDDRFISIISRMLRSCADTLYKEEYIHYYRRHDFRSSSLRYDGGLWHLFILYDLELDLSSYTKCLKLKYGLDKREAWAFEIIEKIFCTIKKEPIILQNDSNRYHLQLLRKRNNFCKFILKQYMEYGVPF